MKYTLKEFIQKFRPDGKGHIWFNEEHIAEFEEVLCDSCNKQIMQPENEPDKKVVFMPDDAHAWCEDCFKEFGSETEFKYEIGKRYTVFGISSFMASTWKAEIEVNSLDENAWPIFKQRGKRKLKKFIDNNKETAVFEGWDIPLNTDSELCGKTGTIMRGNACFNFVGKPEEIKKYIDEKQLNPAFEKSRVLSVSKDEARDETVVYPELVIKGEHAVVDRLIGNKTKEAN